MTDWVPDNPWTMGETYATDAYNVKDSPVWAAMRRAPIEDRRNDPAFSGGDFEGGRVFPPGTYVGSGQPVTLTHTPIGLALGSRDLDYEMGLQALRRRR
jgi:beta-glucosidase-like glycosyl hydrolase